MTITDGSLRLYLTFHDGLKKVEVQAAVPAATRQIDDPSLPRKGFTDGAEELESVLDAANVDHLQVTPGDAGTPGSMSTAVARSPKRIVEDLKETFAKDGEHLKSVVVYACSVPTAQGVERVTLWFEKRDGDSRVRSAAR